MAFGDHTVKEPHEYELEYERVLHIDGALEQHNAAVELLQRVRTDRELTDLADYDPILRKLDRLEREAGRRMAEAASEDATPQ